MTSQSLRIAIINKEKCKPSKCNFECGLICPINRQHKECISLVDIEDISSKKKIASINEIMCIGCGMCAKPAHQRGCPFGAIMIVNIPTELKGNVVMRYGTNGFRLYKMPILQQGKILGFIGQNGIGKSTVVQILSNKIKPNFEKLDTTLSDTEIVNNFKGSELHKFMKKLYENKLRISIKPQHVDFLINCMKSKNINPTVQQYIKNKSKCDISSLWYNEVIETLEIEKILNSNVITLSGGELQRLICATTLLIDADVYIFDEPTNYLDVRQRLNVARLIRSLNSPDKYIVVIEHDLAILDYLSDSICIFYGKPSAYGVVSRPLSTSNGINDYFEGYISSENMRFRQNEYNLGCLDVCENNKLSYNNDKIKYNSKIIEYESFKLHIKSGEFPSSGSITIVMGKNGTGKSTFINYIASEMNESISHKPQYLSVEQFKLSDDEYPTVKEFMMSKIKSRYLNDLFKSLVLKPMMIESIEDRYLNELSGGEMQRFWIAYCLGQDAHIYLIDEPSACLDIEQRVNVTKVLKKFFSQHNKVGFVVEHDMMMAVSLGLEQNSQSVIIEENINIIENKRNSIAYEPTDFKIGINNFLKSLNITFHTQTHSKHNRPRINKPNSVKDREQKSQNKYYD